jgi:DNA-binding NarL/FixJ family response regulator
MLTSLVLFEDNTGLRKSLVNLLNNSKEYIVSGDYSNAMNAANIVRSQLPDIIILDINMPGINGIEAISVIKEEKPDVAIIMYTQFEDEDKIFKSLCAGADGYILKKTSPHKLVEAIKEVCEGGAPLSPSIAKKILGSFKVKPKPASTHFNLTTKETEILQLLVKGYSVKLIASEMKTSYNTTRTHLRNIYRKLHVNCGKEAIAKILAEKIIL